MHAQPTSLPVRAGRLALAALGCAVLLALPGCGTRPALSASDARAGILAHLPPGWTVAQDAHNRFPFEQQPGKDRPLGEFLLLAGPTPVKVSGYYCDHSYCKDQAAREALELWIMPADYRDDGPGQSLMAERAPDRIYQDRRIQIFAMTSRLLDSGRAYDTDVTDASTEASPLGAPSKGDPLALSWHGWREEIDQALRAKTTAT
ncbi:MAG: hypothetical protein ABIS14_06080 [Sphingomonas sp.]